MARPVITNEQARRYLLHRLGLSAPPRRALDGDGLQDLIERLGYVQLDSINTVARAHHLILFARNQTYRPAQLSRLLEREASLFENWTHDAAVIPTRFYPYWVPRFARARTRLRDRWRKWRRTGFEEMLDQVLHHVRDNGPVMARQLGNGEKKKGADGWWDWHPSKTALEFLWRTGDLAVARREGFQKVYDLTERVIPGQYLGDTPSHQAYIDWACRNALDRLGFAAPGQIAEFWGDLSAAEAQAWCRAHLPRELIEIEVEPGDGGQPRPAYALAGIMDQVAEAPPAPGRLRVLSPFDPLIRDRNRCQRLFGFNYRIEVFVPEAKRQFGYYVFPLLQGERLVGRIDMKHRRQDGALGISGLWFEPGVRPGRGRLDRLDAELQRIAKFVGADRVTYANGYLKQER